MGALYAGSMRQELRRASGAEPSAAPEPVSPEIVLVSSPLEAERFRAALPEAPPDLRSRRERATGRRVTGVRRAVRVAALGLVALLGYVAATRWPHPPGPRLLTAVQETRSRFGRPPPSRAPPPRGTRRRPSAAWARPRSS